MLSYATLYNVILANNIIKGHYITLYHFTSFYNISLLYRTAFEWVIIYHVMSYNMNHLISCFLLWDILSSSCRSIILLVPFYSFNYCSFNLLLIITYTYSCCIILIYCYYLLLLALLFCIFVYDYMFVYCHYVIEYEHILILYILCIYKDII